MSCAIFLIADWMRVHAVASAHNPALALISGLQSFFLYSWCLVAAVAVLIFVAILTEKRIEANARRRDRLREVERTRLREIQYEASRVEEERRRTLYVRKDVVQFQNQPKNQLSSY